MLLAHPRGHYHFLQGIEPYSCGVVADPGHAIVHVTLKRLLPWQAGFERIDAHLRALGLDRSALCGVELRSPAPFTMQGFIDFNQKYCRLLQSWDLYVDGLNPVARTNVAPLQDPPAAVALHGFSYAAPVPEPGARTLVVAGAGELREGVLEEERIIRPGDVSADGLREKAAYVMGVMEERLRGLGGSWEQVTAVNVYTVYLKEGLLEKSVLPRLGPARRHGLRWHCTRPPVLDIDFEMDLRGVRTELLL